MRVYGPLTGYERNSLITDRPASTSFQGYFSCSILSYSHDIQARRKSFAEEINSKVRSYLRGLYYCPFKRLRTVLGTMIACACHSYWKESPRDGHGESPILCLLFPFFSSLFLSLLFFLLSLPHFFVFLQSTLTRCFGMFSARTRGRSPWPGNTKACRPGKGERNDCSEQLKIAVWYLS